MGVDIYLGIPKVRRQVITPLTKLEREDLVHSQARKDLPTLLWCMGAIFPVTRSFCNLKSEVLFLLTVVRMRLSRDLLAIVFCWSYSVINLSSKFPATNRGGVVVGSARQLYRRPISLMRSTIPSTTPHPSSK